MSSRTERVEVGDIAMSHVNWTDGYYVIGRIGLSAGDRLMLIPEPDYPVVHGRDAALRLANKLRAGDRKLWVCDNRHPGEPAWVEETRSASPT